MMYMFDGEIAKDVGVNAAVLFHSIQWWIRKNKANDKNFFDGKYWTYNSVAAFTELFPFMKKSAIRSSLEKLEKEGYIVSGNYNKIAYDRTKWYALGDKGEALSFEDSPKSTLNSSKIHLQKNANQYDEKNKPIPVSIPVSYTDNNTGNILSGKPDPSSFVHEVVSYLNEKAGTKYRDTSEKTKKLVVARWREGWREKEFRAVIDTKCADWLRNPDMAKYLRPETLFGTKFESYLNESIQFEKKRRAEYMKHRESGRWVTG